MSKKIFRSVVAVALAVLLISLAFITCFLYEYFNRLQVVSLKEELALASIGVEISGTDYFDGYSSDSFRFTLISSDGSVLYDSQINNIEMENHLDRKEISDALQNGSGSSARYSKTLTERTFYEAVRLSDGNILRISATQVTIATLLMAMLPIISAVILFATITAVVLSHQMANSIVKPLESLDLENPEKNDTYDELTPVLSKLERQHKQIKYQMRELKRKSDEFEQITASLSEGMVLIDKNGNVIALNESAKKLFNSDNGGVGHSFLNIDRSIAMCNAVNKALAGEHCEFRKEISGGEFQIMITPTVSDGKILGAVILCIDVTETVFAERNRREFTANVSHELKTPLQSIIGSSELLESGLVKAEDTERFIGNIKNEALRLLALINDIIRLSQLDENNELPCEKVDIYEEAKDVKKDLSAAAEKKQIKVSVVGESCIISGVRRYIYEILYNLCDNAISYNKTGGEVEITVKKENEKIIISVSDTGIGIPAEHKSRIFERFYRVDKSHSKETGGTGLGLSIVKHAVSYMRGKIDLQSEVGKGTTVTVTFEM